MALSQFGNILSEGKEPEIELEPERYINYAGSNVHSMVTDSRHIMPESMRCAWYALGCHDMTRSLESFSAFQTYLNCFKTAETEPKKNEYYKFVEHLFRPMFANLHNSHIPHLGALAGYDLDH